MTERPARLDFELIDRYRRKILDHRLNWFDSLSVWDQQRLAEMDEHQRDHDEERETLGGPGR